MEEAKFPELQFSRGYALDNNKQILIVTQRHLAYHPPFGYVSRARITFQEDGSYTVHILMCYRYCVSIYRGGAASLKARSHPLYALILHMPIERWILSLTTIINSW